MLWCLNLFAVFKIKLILVFSVLFFNVFQQNIEYFNTVHLSVFGKLSTYLLQLLTEMKTVKILEFLVFEIKLK